MLSELLDLVMLANKLKNKKKAEPKENRPLELPPSLLKQRRNIVEFLYFESEPGKSSTESAATSFHVAFNPLSHHSVALTVH